MNIIVFLYLEQALITAFLKRDSTRQKHFSPLDFALKQNTQACRN